MPCEKRNMYH
uniref:Uncharacterized protein n=1 Tax=Anguilla anguilla TaxID=7936 RepID=A0A0E9VVB6_ANGAN